MATKISKNPLSLITLIGIMILSACQPKATATSEAPAPGPSANLTQEQTLTIGVVSDDPAGTIEGFQPLMDYLAEQLGDLGIEKGSVVVTPDFDTMNEKLKSGEVDLFYETAYGALDAYENAGAIPLLRGWRKEIGEYHSTIFVRKDSGITSIDDLRGKFIAFAEPDSTSGYFLPKAFLISSGLSLSEQSATSAVPSGEVGYIITGSDENEVSFVLLGKAIGGGIEHDVFDDLKQEDKDQLTVLAQTQDLPRSLLMASPKMAQPLRERIISTLKEASQSDEGKAALKGAKKTTQFDDFPLGADATMKFIQDLFALLK
jgi:phosphonate transport system substrate-binding protein